MIQRLAKFYFNRIQHANENSSKYIIQKNDIEVFDLDELFEGKNVNDQVCLFNKTILQTLIPNKTITCNDKDPQWLMLNKTDK